MFAGDFDFAAHLFDQFATDVQAEAYAALVGSLGSAAAGAGDATLTSTEADMIASTTGTLTSGAGTLTKYGSLVAAAFDGTSAAKSAYLNVAVPDAGSSGNDALIVNGTITIFWADLSVTN